MVSCKPLRTLYTEGLETSPNILLDTIRPVTPPLRTMALGPVMWAHDDLTKSVNFQYIGQNFPKLQFLGYPLWLSALHTKYFGTTLKTLKVSAPRPPLSLQCADLMARHS